MPIISKSFLKIVPVAVGQVEEKISILEGSGKKF